MSFLSDTNKIKKECSIDLSLKKMNKRGCLLQILVFKKLIYKIDPLIAESGDSKSKKFLFERISLAFEALLQIPDYYRKFLYCKTKILCIT
jgi:hypothetical protein